MRKYNIPIFIPHEGCGYSCLFCNQRRITGVESTVTPEMAKSTVKEYLSTVKSGECEIEIAYFGGSFTGLSLRLQEEFFKAAMSFNDDRITGIRLSTRPDYISDEILKQCKAYGVTTIELGVQSASDDVLSKNRRGHTFADVKTAAGMIKNYDISLGLQMMVGMYGSDRELDLMTCRSIIDLKPSCTRIYPTLVLRGTPLEKLYRDGGYTPYSIDEAVEVSKECLIAFRENDIDVIRIGLYSGEDLREVGNIVAGPFHSAFGELVENAIYRDKIEAEIIKNGIRNTDYIINAAPSEVSKIIGQKRSNKIYFSEKYGVNIKVKPMSGEKNA